jgi:DNA-binding beta-propeller fold protein YncE
MVDKLRGITLRCLTMWTVIAVSQAAALQSAEQLAAQVQSEQKPGECDFSAVPKAEDMGDSVRLTFSVTKYTDVTVEVVDAAGKRIRALAAGTLGPNPPAPLQANSLKQTLTWDKKTDRGQPAPAGWHLRVGLGLAADFDRIYDANGPGYIDEYVLGATTDDQGNVYVLSGAQEPRLTAFTRDNKHLRVLIPYPSDRPEEKLKGFGRAQLPGGKHMPVVYMGLADVRLPEMYAPGRQGMVATPQGWLALVNGCVGPKARRVVIMGLDGSCPRDSLLGPTLPWRNVPYKADSIYLAVSPDGKFVYAAGAAGHYSVAKSLLDFDGKMDLFLGKDAESGNDDKHLHTPRGVATDKDGNVYVADFGNNRIMVFKPTGEYLAQAPCTSPDQIKVNPRNGEVFVLALDTTKKLATLIKYSALPALKSVSTVAFPWSYLHYPPALALDHAAAKPLAWVGQLNYGQFDLVAVEDQGKALAKLPKKIGGRRCGWFSGNGSWPGYVTVDPEEKLLYEGGISYSRVDLATGTVTKSKATGIEAQFGPDGSLYVQRALIDTRGDPGVHRFDQREQRVAFANGRMDFAGPATFYQNINASRGFHVARNGDFYFLYSTNMRTSPDSFVSIYGADGKVKRSKVISTMTTAAGIQTDKAGNMFMTFNARPKGMSYPSIYKGSFFPDPQVVSPRKYPFGPANNYYMLSIGSLFKFPPTGGKIVQDKTTTVAKIPAGNLDGFNVPPQQVNGMYNQVISVTGPVWQYFGASPCPDSASSLEIECSCTNLRFSVDDFGMIYLPDQFSSSVMVLDNNKNEILRLGEYGNADQRGKGSGRPNPSIPLATPRFVTKVNNSLYISDPGNRRIVRVKLGHSVLWDSGSGVKKARAEEK